ncbi:MAG: cytochrome c oxidase cbb3-type subunit 1 [Verrucomicrobia bacterium]|nr:MAG: cytochrome c oxidase cbb3-type subunit 1 [Verrucomicrobiota bacterium]
MSQETPSLPPGVTPEDILQRAAIDKSTRLPVLFFFTSGAAWLLVATLLGLLASLKFVVTGAFKYEVLNLARVQPAFVNALVYGWAYQAGFGVMIWIMARLCRTELRNPVTLIVAGHFWNLGVTLGVAGILGGQGNLHMKLLEFPAMVWPLLLAAYLLIVVWLVVMYSARRPGSGYISQWYILAACFTWPWMYLVANVLLNVFKKAGVAGPVVASWYANGVTFLWMVPVGLASAYFVIPKITGKAIHSYNLSSFAFWSLLVLAPWAGAQELIGGPVPAWIPAVAGTAQILLLIPMLAVCLNHYQTVRGAHELVNVSPSLRFTFFAAVGYVCTCVASAVLGSMSLSRYTFLSFAQDGVMMMGTYMFFTMAMFGAIYFIVPRITACEWVSGSRIRLHFWLSAYAIIGLCSLLLIAGVSHGSAIDEWESSFETAVMFSKGYLVGRIFLWAFLVAANFIFIHQLVLMVMNRGRKAGTPTLIHQPTPYETAELVITTEGAEA